MSTTKKAPAKKTAAKAPAKKAATPRKRPAAKPADHLPKQNEANPDEAQDITFRHGGHDYVIPAEAFDDVEILELLEDEKNISAVRQMLGPEQWDVWKDRNRVGGRISASDAAVPFLQEIFKAAGQGNS